MHQQYTVVMLCIMILTSLQVFDALRHDFNTRRRERCVRLDFPVQQGQGSIAGLEELEQLLKAAIKASFETRAAAYEEEVCPTKPGAFLL